MDPRIGPDVYRELAADWKSLEGVGQGYALKCLIFAVTIAVINGTAQTP